MNVTREPAGTAFVMLAAPIVVGAVLALGLALARRKPAIGAWLKSVFGEAAGAGSRTAAMREALGSFVHGSAPLAALRDAVVGAGKGAVVNVFGPPHTAMIGRGVSALSIWRSDTWYYPLDPADRTALAIRFEGNVARDVEQISVPEVTAG